MICLRLTVVLLAMATVLVGCASQSLVGTYRIDAQRSFEETVALAKREKRLDEGVSLDDPRLAMDKVMAGLGEGRQPPDATLTLRSDGTGTIDVKNPYGEDLRLDGQWTVEDDNITLAGDDDEFCPLAVLNDEELVCAMGDHLFVFTRRK